MEKKEDKKANIKFIKLKSLQQYVSDIERKEEAFENNYNAFIHEIKGNFDSFCKSVTQQLKDIMEQQGDILKKKREEESKEIIKENSSAIEGMTKYIKTEFNLFTEKIQTQQKEFTEKIQAQQKEFQAQQKESTDKMGKKQDEFTEKNRAQLQQYTENMDKKYDFFTDKIEEIVLNFFNEVRKEQKENSARIGRDFSEQMKHELNEFKKEIGNSSQRIPPEHLSKVESLGEEIKNSNQLCLNRHNKMKRRLDSNEKELVSTRSEVRVLKIAQIKDYGELKDKLQLYKMSILKHHPESNDSLELSAQGCLFDYQLTSHLHLI